MSRESRNKATPKYISFEAWGDHRGHFFEGGEYEVVHDEVSQVDTIRLTESQAKDLYWWLLKTIPSLIDDQR